MGGPGSGQAQPWQSKPSTWLSLRSVRAVRLTPICSTARFMATATAVAPAAALGARGITVNTLAPGLTSTDLNAGLRENQGLVRTFEGITAMGRLGTVEDIAGAASVLASPEAGWITGQYVEASGGLGLVMPGV